MVVLSGIATLMTVGVYGLVAGIVKLDDGGLLLAEREGAGVMAASIRWFGRGILAFAPWLMRALSVVGTVAMFAVGGGILAHASHAVMDLIEQGVHWLDWGFYTPLEMFATGVIGLLVGLTLVKGQSLLFDRH